MPRKQSKPSALEIEIGIREAVTSYLNGIGVEFAKVGPRTEITYAAKRYIGHFDDDARYETAHYRVTISKLD